MRRIAAVAVFVLCSSGCGGDGGDDVLPEPREERIAFASSRDGDFEIYSMRPDGSDVRQLTRNATSPASENDDSLPTWSPDATQIAFTSTRDHEGDGIDAKELYVMNADGTQQRRLTEDEPSVVPAGWRPDGQIEFVRCAQGITDCALMTVDPEGGDPEGVYEFNGTTEFVQLAPDAERLVIQTFNPAAARLGARVEVANLDGGDRQVLIDHGGEPAWSPNGKRLVFVTDRDRNGRCLFHDCTGNAPELYVADGDGSNQRRLTRTTAQEAHPRWSPDGTKLLFARIESEDDDYELFVMNADGSCMRQLTDNDEWDWLPDWTGPRGSGAPLAC